MALNDSQVYLTVEQIQRLAALACDALVGIQVSTDDGDDTPLLADVVDIDDPSRSRHFLIASNGALHETT